MVMYRRAMVHCLVRSVGLAVVCWTALYGARRPATNVPVDAAPLAGYPAVASTAAASPMSHIFAISFADQRHGWVLGVSSCSATAQPCPFALRQTSDGGLIWQPRSFPGPWPSTASSSLLFVTPRDGWLYGPALFVTYDGGRTWDQTRQQGTVLALARWGGRVWSVTQHCIVSQCVVRLRSSADLGRTWQLPSTRPALIEFSAVASHLYLYQPAELTGLNARTAWLLLTLSRFHTVLLVTHDGARTWQQVTQPCAEAFTTVLSALPPDHLWLLCGGEPSTGNQAKTLFVSQDGGQHWQAIAQTTGGSFREQVTCSAAGCGALPIDGYIAQLQMTTPQRGWFTGGRSNLEGTWNGGKTWKAPIPDPMGYADAGFLGPMTFVDPQHGWIAAICGVYRTIDGGVHWCAVTISTTCSSVYGVLIPERASEAD